MAQQLRESVAEAPVKTGNRWRVIIARPGQGSSGKYSAELFRRDAQKLIPPGAQSFLNHDEARNPRDMIGTYPDGGYFDEAENAVVADLDVFSHFKDFVSEVGPHCGISLYAMGDKDEDDNITQFVEDAYNGADLVSRAGLMGSGLAEKLYEAAIAASEKPGTETSVQERKDKQDMDEKVLEAVNALTTQVAALVSANTVKAEENAQVEADEKAVTEAVEVYAAKVEAVESARSSLLPSQVTHLMAEAKAGNDVTLMIESFKTLAEEAKAAVAEGAPTGRVVESATENTYGAWK